MTKSTTVPFEMTVLVRDTCVCLHTQRAARAIGRYFDEALRPVGLTNGQFSLLMSLNRPVPPGIKSVADLLAMDRTTLTAALKPLERRGLIKIATDPDDRRLKRLTLTQAGIEALAAAIPIWKTHHRLIERGLPEPADQFLRGLGVLAVATP
jgi:DNA-binding MarR family transcriptional regulator